MIAVPEGFFFEWFKKDCVPASQQAGYEPKNTPCASVSDGAKTRLFSSCQWDGQSLLVSADQGRVGSPGGATSRSTSARG